MSDDVRRIEDLVDYWTPLLVRMCGEVGVFDTFGAAARHPNAVAAELRLHGPTLSRVVRALAMRGLFHESGDGNFELTTLGALLRTDGEGSLAGLAAFRPSDIHAWAEALYSLRTGDAAFPAHFGHDFWTHLSANAEIGERFDAQMRRRTSTLLDLGFGSFDWPERGTIVDLGGGDGLLLTRVLELRPQLHGVLFDRPMVAERARHAVRVSGLEDRMSVVSGDLFTEAYPGDGDVYVLASVLHDWNDIGASEILRRCRAAMPHQSKLLLFEAVLPPGHQHDLGKLLDLHMLVLFGAKERELEEWRELLEDNQFTITKVVATPGLSWIAAQPA